MAFDVADYLRMAQGQTIPPLVLEIVLRTGRSYYVKEVVKPFNEDGLFAIRVWDLRALDANEMPQLLALLNASDRDVWSEGPVHPKLDQANVWLRVDDVEHFVEWHDRAWPLAPESLEERVKEIGFKAKGP
jgi:hypothetical protein